MECNKDEADRALQIALAKFHENDIHGAKRFANKAQKLFPEQERIQQLLETLNVHIAATKGNGEMDWYAILNVNPLDDEEAIKKSYMKMLLLVHPDKNKWVGANEAFRLVSEAWTILHNKDRRAAYDHSRKGKQIFQDTPVASVSTSSSIPFPGSSNGIFDKNAINLTTPPTDFCPKPATNQRTQKETRGSDPKQQAGQGGNESKSKKYRPSQKETFWTACTHCKFKFEFQRIYVNAKLLCPRAECKKIFSATETNPPQLKESEKKESESSKKRKLNKFTESGDSPTSSPPALKTAQVPHFGTETTSATVSATIPAEPGKRIQNLIRKEPPILFHENTYCRNGNRANSCPQNDLDLDGNPTRKRCINGKEMPKDVPYENGGSVSLAEKPVNRLNEMSRENVKEKLRKIANAAIREKLMDWKNKAAATSKKSCEVGSSGVKGKQLKGSSNLVSEKAGDVTPPPSDAKGTGMEVPDQDFHNFDCRNEWKFEKGQVWALYDEPHGLPRLYAAVYSMVSQKPFKVMLRWLHAKNNEVFGPMEWIASGFQKTCGVFYRGERELVDAELCFSHIVSCKVGGRGVTHIYPKKGDVWAVYRNWSLEWDASVRSSPEVFNQFDIVEVLRDYTEETGITVAPLIKVPGFKSVMKRNSDPSSYMRFPKHEIFRLSHQVPFCLLTEDSYPRAPRGCIEIDLGAVPSDFAELIPEESPSNNLGKESWVGGR